MSSVPERNEIADDDKWDLESVFADDEAWENAFRDVRDRVDDLRAYEGKATENAATLLELLEHREEVMRDVATVSTYANLRQSEDTRDGEAQAMAARAESLAAATGGRTIGHVESLDHDTDDGGAVAIRDLVL
jgi:oligoendopeptidase F